MELLQDYKIKEEDMDYYFELLKKKKSTIFEEKSM
jgi:hypothetical protein